MRRSNIYIGIWKKYLPVVKMKIKTALSTGEVQCIQLSEIEFRSVGNRQSAGYQFNIELKQGSVINNISGSAVARDFVLTLTESPDIKEVLLTSYINIKLTSAFLLSINRSNKI